MLVCLALAACKRASETDRDVPKVLNLVSYPCRLRMSSSGLIEEYRQSSNGAKDNENVQIVIPKGITPYGFLMAFDIYVTYRKKPFYVRLDIAESDLQVEFKIADINDLNLEEEAGSNTPIPSDNVAIGVFGPPGIFQLNTSIKATSKIHNRTAMLIQVHKSVSWQDFGNGINYAKKTGYQSYGFSVVQ